ncbi:MAG: radical SAM protein [Candidatus Cloacimonetes bacterium]|nr:radical SAM protein [Candidatus Cloacimonadota bacterium]
MKKIAIISINARWTHSNLAVYYLKKTISDLPVDVNVIEFNINQPLLEMLEILHKSDADILAFSVYIWNSDIVGKLITECKKILPDSLIVLGGPEVSYSAEQWLKNYSAIDYIICGNGEQAFRQLITENSHDLPTIISLPNPHFSEIPFPYDENDWENLNHKYIYYESSRGCPFKCSYCLSSRQDQKLQYKAIDTIVAELSEIISRKPKIIKFVDRTFNSDSKHARAIWSYLKEFQTPCHFEIHPQLLKEDDFEFLSTIPKNLFQFEIGIQTLNNVTLKAIHRNHEWQKVKDNILRLLKLGNIHIHVDLIQGLPYESSESFADSFNEVYNLKADQFQLGFLKVLPGTEIYEKQAEYGMKYLSYPPYQILSTKWLSFAETCLWEKIEHLLNIYYNSHNFQKTFIELESLYISPFELFYGILSFFQKKKFKLNSKDWQTNASGLLEFITENHPNKISFFRDCLRWDWCYLANSHYYPPFIDSAELHTIRKKHNNKLKAVISSNNLKCIIYLLIETERFAEKYSKNCREIAWLHRRDKVERICLEDYSILSTE